jgi:hypothetical protein
MAFLNPLPSFTMKSFLPLLAAALLPTAVLAQAASSTAAVAPAAAKEEVVELSPFEVSTTASARAWKPTMRAPPAR